MNCLYFVFWAQNQLRSGNNTLCQCQPYSSNHLLCCQDNAPLYATWRLNSVIVGTSANSAHGLVTHVFSGHIIRDGWCHGHIRCLAPHAMAIENPRVRIHCRTPIQSVQSPQQNRNDVSLGPERPRPREGRLCSRMWQFPPREDLWPAFCWSVAPARRAMKIAFWGVHAFIQAAAERGWGGRGRGKQIVYF